MVPNSASPVYCRCLFHTLLIISNPDTRQVIRTAGRVRCFGVTFLAAQHTHTHPTRVGLCCSPLSPVRLSRRYLYYLYFSVSHSNFFNLSLLFLCLPPFTMRRDEVSYSDVTNYLLAFLFLRDLYTSFVVCRNRSL